MPSNCLLYYITDRTAFAFDEPTRRRRLLEKIAEAARAGVDYIQLREKDLSTRDLESLAREAVTVISQLKTENRELRTALLINSRTDVAVAVGADGVHLRSDDVSPQHVRAVWSQACGAGGRASSIAKPLVGISCHSPEDVAQARANGASFTVFAPIFEKNNVQPAGLRSLQKACKEPITVLALGGVTLENARSCLDAGASGIAAIRLFQETHLNQIVPILRGR